MHTRHTQHVGHLNVDTIHQSVHVRKTVPAEHPLGVAVRGNNSMSEAQTAEEEPLVVRMASAASCYVVKEPQDTSGSCTARFVSSSRLHHKHAYSSMQV